MHVVAAAWLMTSLTSSPTLIALLQTAMTLPVLFFSIPGGLLAALFPLKKFLCITQAWMALTALLLCVMTASHMVTPYMLLSITFVLGAGSALNMPALQTAITTMVPAKDMREATTLNSIGFNAARLLGPAIGGYLIARHGPSLVFMIDTLSFLGVIFFFLRFYRQVPDLRSSHPNLKKSFAGFADIIARPHFKNILKRAAFFFFCSSIVWALSPILAKKRLGEGIACYTHFIMCLGMGAVLGGLLLARLREQFSGDRVVFASLLLLSLFLGTILFAKSHALIYGSLILIGFAWIASSSTFNVTVLQSFPDQLKSRAFALYWIVFNGSFAFGSAIWGRVTSVFDFRTSLLLATALAFGAALLSLSWKIAEE
jgi:predicted MFS family arabinose efflux permease